MLLTEQRRKLGVAFNTVVRRCFGLSRYASVRDVIVLIGFKPCDILLEKSVFCCFYHV
jgi:hypothetical protein